MMKGAFFFLKIETSIFEIDEHKFKIRLNENSSNYGI